MVKNMIKSGLVSVTFRALPVKEVIDLAVKAKLDAIEWGGDVHVPHGDIQTAKLVGKMTRDAGLEVAAYGSYYRFKDEVPFEDVVETAIELGAPTIRVWAGTEGSELTTYSSRSEIVAKSVYISKMAAKVGVKVAYEYHGNTLTDTSVSAVTLLESVNHQNTGSYWQPLDHHSLDERLKSLVDIMPWLTNIHVYHWENRKRLPFSAGMDEWIEYLKLVRDSPRDHYALLEFVKDDQPEQFLNDAKHLQALLADVAQNEA